MAIRAKGVKCADIIVLAYYAAERQLIRGKLRKQVGNEVDSLRMAGTVDSFQGQERKVVIVDHVVAYQFIELHSGEIRGKAQGIEEDPQEDDQVRDVIRDVGFMKGMTSHTKDRNRLNTALTRAKDGKIMLLHASTVMLDDGKKTPEHYSAIHCMVQGAINRGCYFYDDTHVDTSEEGKKERERYTAEMKAEQERLRTRLMDNFSNPSLIGAVKQAPELVIGKVDCRSRRRNGPPTLSKPSWAALLPNAFVSERCLLTRFLDSVDLMPVGIGQSPPFGQLLSPLEASQ